MENRQLKHDEVLRDRDDEVRNIDKDRLPISLILDGLSDLRNIGSIFRIADSLRIEHIYIKNFVGVWDQNKMKRYSRSTIKYVSYSFIETDLECKKILSQHYSLALEISSNSKIFSNSDYNFPLVLVIGAENEGVSQTLLNLVNGTIHLPMLGINTSINVSNATSAALYYLYTKLDQNS